MARAWQSYWNYADGEQQLTYEECEICFFGSEGRQQIFYFCEVYHLFYANIYNLERTILIESDSITLQS